MSEQAPTTKEATKDLTPAVDVVHAIWVSTDEHRRMACGLIVNRDKPALGVINIHERGREVTCKACLEFLKVAMQGWAPGQK